MCEGEDAGVCTNNLCHDTIIMHPLIADSWVYAFSSRVTAVEGMSLTQMRIWIHISRDCDTGCWIVIMKINKVT